MKIKLIISKTSNQYFFLDTFSNDSPTDSSNFTNSYIKLLENPTTKEFLFLNDYREWFKNADEPQRKSVMKAFYQSQNEADAYKRTAEIFPSIVETCTKLDPYFSFVWKTCEIVLNKSKSYIENDYFRIATKFDDCFNLLNNFYGKAPGKDEINVNLVYSPAENNFSGRFIDQNQVSICIQNVDETNVQKFWLILLHESMHACYEDAKYKKWLKDFADNQTQTDLSGKMGAKNLLRELIVSCFAGVGFLKEYLYGADIKKELEEAVRCIGNNKVLPFRNLKRVVALEMLTMVREYVRQRKQIDENFLDKIWKLILKYS